MGHDQMASIEEEQTTKWPKNNGHTIVYKTLSTTKKVKIEPN